MERDDFKKIIKLRCGLKNKKASNSIKTPYDGYLKEYITKLVKSQMEIDSLGIMLNGNLCLAYGGGWNVEKQRTDDYTLISGDYYNETCSTEEMKQRIAVLAAEIVDD